MYNYKNLVQIFNDLAEYEQKFKNRYFPARAFRNSAKLVENSESFTIDEIGIIHLDVGNLGASSSEIFVEYINKGFSSRLHEYIWTYGPLYTDKLIAQITRIPGIGEVKAKKIIEAHPNLTFEMFMTLIPPKVGMCIFGTNITYTEMMNTGIEMMKITKGERLPWDDANKLANKIIYAVQNNTDVNHYTYKLGSLRRHKDTVGDIDLCVSGCDSDEFPELHKLYFNELDKIFVNGESKISGIKNGFQVDIRFIDKKYLGCHILHGTGSQEFNIKLRAHAKSLGMKLNEYCITDKDGTEKYFSNELEVFEFLGLKYVPPKYR